MVPFPRLRVDRNRERLPPEALRGVCRALRAYDDDNCRRAPQRCPKACERLLDHATQSRPSVDRMLSPTRGLATRALLVVVFVVALAVLASATFPAISSRRRPSSSSTCPCRRRRPGTRPNRKRSARGEALILFVCLDGVTGLAFRRRRRTAARSPSGRRPATPAAANTE